MPRSDIFSHVHIRSVPYNLSSFIGILTQVVPINQLHYQLLVPSAFSNRTCYAFKFCLIMQSTGVNWKAQLYSIWIICMISLGSQSLDNLSKAAALMILILRQHYLLSLLVDIEHNTPLLLYIPFYISINDRNVFYLP